MIIYLSMIRFHLRINLVNARSVCLRSPAGDVVSAAAARSGSASPNAAPAGRHDARLSATLRARLATRGSSCECCAGDCEVTVSVLDAM